MAEEKVSRRRFLKGLLWLVPAVAIGTTIYRLASPPPPKLKAAELHVYSLEVVPSEAKVGEPVQVNVGVVNIGDVNGTFTVQLKVDGEVVETKEVTLVGKTPTFVTFKLVNATEGTHKVEVDGLTRTLKVLKPVSPVTIPPELKKKFLKLLPEAAEFKPVVKDGEVIYYEAYDKTGSLIAYAFAKKAYGPSERLEVVGIINLDYKVVAIDVEPLPQNPHLLNPKIIGPEFEDQFVGLSVKELYLSPKGKIDAASGATLSSEAVTNAVRETIEEIISEHRKS
ncbi:MAG: FMN-binding protein [Thaumarchaeota archaeon]|nr:FMN-binding protein [Nitrososphaerota archaeon]